MLIVLIHCVLLAHKQRFFFGSWCQNVYDCGACYRLWCFSISSIWIDLLDNHIILTQKAWPNRPSLLRTYKYVCRYSSYISCGIILPPVAHTICVAFFSASADRLCCLRYSSILGYLENPQGPANAAQLEGSIRMLSELLRSRR